MRAARILVLTGDGKGKTTSALGMILRALGHGQRVLLARFCKAAPSGELAALAHFTESGLLTVLHGDCGMTPPAEHPDFHRHKEAANALFTGVRAAASGCDLLVLDEVCGAVAKDLLDAEDVVRFLAALRGDQAAVLTGRNACEKILDAADTVSEVVCVRHGYARGIPAQDGIEK